MKKVLFVCTHNAGRSQMAQAFFNRMAPDDISAESAGQQPRREGVWPEVAEVMREVGFDLSDARPTKLSVEMQLHADWAVTMGCGDACPYVPTRVEDWELDDPAGLDLENVRVIRDDIEERVRTLLEDRLPEMLNDRTAHQLRLARLLPSLVEEFEGLRTPGQIRDCADAILDEYDDAPVRSFLSVIVDRKARECLRAERCDALAAG